MTTHAPRPTVDPTDIAVREVSRRSFIRMLGISAPAWALAAGACEPLLLSDVKLRSDRDVTVRTTDFDPFDLPNRIVRHGDPVRSNDFD